MQTNKNPFAEDRDNAKAQWLASTNAKEKKRYREQFEHYDREARRWESNRRSLNNGSG